MPELRSIALRALRGIGDASLGEWEEQGDIAYHVRRRLADTPYEQGRVIPAVCDVRGTPEALRRFAAMSRALPPQAVEMALKEISAMTERAAEQAWRRGAV